MPKTYLIIGHTGFLGRNILNLINEKYKDCKIVGISKSSIDASQYKNITIEQGVSMSAYNSQNLLFDFVLFLAHGQASTNPTSAELELEKDFKDLIKRNKIKCPIVLILSAGLGSDHLNSRVQFNKRIKSELPNRIIEIESSIIASPGSISYEIPYRCIQQLHVLPIFPWYKNKVSLTSIDNVLSVYKQILNGDPSNYYSPKFHDTTYGDYIKKIAQDNNKLVFFIRIPWNEMRLVPLILSTITKLPYHLVKNLFQSLAVPCVIKDNKP